MGWLSDLKVTVIMTFIKLMIHAYEIITWPLYIMFHTTSYFMPFPEDEDFFRKFSAKESRILSLPMRAGDPGTPWRAVEYIDGLVKEALPGCKTISELWLRTVQIWPHKISYGTRTTLDTEYQTLPNGKQIIKLTMGEYVWETYAEAERRVATLAAGLRKILGPREVESGIDPKPIVIFSETRAEWMFAAQAAFRLNRPLATLYSTLGDDAVVHGLEQTEASVIFTSDELISKVVGLLDRCPLVKDIIFFSNGVFQKHSGKPVSDLSRLTDTARKSVEQAKKNIPSNVRLLDILELEKIGMDFIDAEKRGKNEDGKKNCPYINWQPPMNERPKPDDLAVIMYTSGSTGQPKGVEITHNNLLTAIAGYFRRLPKIRPDSDIYIGYLPLAHVLELVCEIVILIMGVPIGYSNPQTLTDTSAKIKKGACKGDITMLKPTLMAAVPTILERVAKSVWERVREGGPLLESIFTFAFDYKHRRLHKGFPSFIVDLLIFRKVRALLGGRIRYIVSGGAPLSAESHLFTNVCFGPLMQGYGLTESCASALLMEPGDLRGHHVGAPTPSIQVKLKEWTDGGYSPYDKPAPRGEILISGGPITRGYYKDPVSTAESFITEPDGSRWFATGDIGMIHEDGSFSIIDRKKDLVKLQAGEYVSLVKVELALAQSSFVENICVYAEPTENYIICFVTPKQSMIRKLGEEFGLMEAANAEAMTNLAPERASDPSALAQAEHDILCRNPEINKRITADIQSVGRSKKLAAFEIPLKVYLDADPWTPESGLVTDALKIKRFNIKTKFVKKIKSMYNLK